MLLEVIRIEAANQSSNELLLTIVEKQYRHSFGNHLVSKASYTLKRNISSLQIHRFNNAEFYPASC